MTGSIEICGYGSGAGEHLSGQRPVMGGNAGGGACVFRMSRWPIPN